MGQNMEQNVQKREYGEAKALKIRRELQLSSHDLPALARYARECFEEGAAQERAKGIEPTAWIITASDGGRFLTFGKPEEGVGEPLYLHASAAMLQVRDLSEALDTIRTVIEHDHHGVISDTLWMPSDVETVVDFITDQLNAVGKE